MLYLFQEAYTLTQAVEQDKVRVRADNRQRHAGKPGAGADINKPATGQMRFDHDTVHDMTHQHLFRLADRSQVIGFVPLVEHLHIAGQLLFLLIGQPDIRTAQQRGKLLL